MAVKPRSRWWIVLVASLLIGGGAGVQLAAGGTAGAQVPETDVLAEPAATSRPVKPPAPSADPERANPKSWPTRPATPPKVRRVPEPEQMRIPSVGLDLGVDPTGVDRRGQMALPDRLDRVGWYRFSAAPGAESGSAVLGGHLDSVRDGVGPLASLAALRRGAEVVVSGSGRTTHYRVVAVQRLPKTKIDTARLFAREGRAVLRIVTCGGSYDPERGYADNVVVTAVPR